MGGNDDLTKGPPHFGHADVTYFGAKGDGVTDDTEAIQRACHRADGLLYFPKGTYVIKRTILIDTAHTGRIRLFGAGATVRHRGVGPAFHIVGHHRVSADPRRLDTEAYVSGAMPLIDGLMIEGAHEEADGIRLESTMQATLMAVTIRRCRHGIHIVGNNRNVIVNGVHIYDNREIGIYLDHVNLHQINVAASHISYNHKGGIKVEKGNIRNIQINGNDIEYNHEGGGSDVWLIAGEIGIREGAITGNTIQAMSRPGGANVRVEGFQPSGPIKAGLLSITGNHISHQHTNIHIADSRGIVVGNNTLKRGMERNIHIERSTLIDINHNILDANPDYGERTIGGVYMRDCRDCIVHGVTISQCHGGTEERGGAIEVIKSEGMYISGCLIVESDHRDVWLEDVRQSRVSGLMIRRTGGEPPFIVETGDSGQNVIRDNMVPRG